MNREIVSIREVTKRDVDDIVHLQKEFGLYLGELSGKRRTFSVKDRKARLIRDGFGNRRAFEGLIARIRGRAVGYVFYHEGYDPDEMSGRVIYVIDLLVSEDIRRSGVGTLLMKRVAAQCRKIKGKDIYLGVWLKNKNAIKFYEKLGAEWVDEVPFMRWTSKKWK